MYRLDSCLHVLQHEYVDAAHHCLDIFQYLNSSSQVIITTYSYGLFAMMNARLLGSKRQPESQDCSDPLSVWPSAEPLQLMLTPAVQDSAEPHELNLLLKYTSLMKMGNFEHPF